MDQSKAIKKVTFPIQAWYVTATSNGLQTVIENAYGSPPGGKPGSLLSDGVVSELYNALIVVNNHVVGGQQIGPISDYIAMLALTRAQASKHCSALPSILNIYSANCTSGEKPGLSRKAISPI